jgi:glycosyltransferase involved in cell wall biosynthesis
LTPAALDAPVVLDLQAVQSPTYRERGVARYALDFAAAMARTAPDLLDQVLVRPDLPAISGHDPVLDGVLTSSPRWDRAGGVFHALSPFDIGTPVRQVWPREASRSGRRLVVTVYDLIPEIFPDTYLVDPGMRRRYRARRELIRAADRVMTLSRSAADDVADLLGIPDDRLTVVGAACSEAFSPGTGDERDLAVAQSLLPGLGRHPVVYNGAVEPRKNMEALVTAYAHLPAAVRLGRQLVLVCRLEPLERNHYEVLGRNLGLAENELLLTGQVSDTALVHLYRSAELVVFPSLYEGYGLPVAEALACGAPVVASGTSSLIELVEPEATFDPHDTDDLTLAIERGLVDRPFRERLLRWSARTRTTWTEVADRAAEAYRSVAFDRGHTGWRRPAAWRQRPALALVTPWPPATTGVASYSRRLTEALSASVDVDLFVDGDPPSDPGYLDGLDSYPAWSLPHVDAVRGGYDAVVASIGNSEHHTGALRLLRVDAVPAFVLAHDVRLNGLYRHGGARGAVPEGTVAAVKALYPDATDEWFKDGWLQPAEAEAHDAFMARELIGLSERFIVTSTVAADLAVLDARPEDRDRVFVCPYAYPPAVGRGDAAEEPGLICTFGLVNSVKLPELLVASFAVVHRSQPSSRLVFVGPIDPSLADEYRLAATASGVAESVSFTGEVDDAEYERWLGRASVAVQLRASTNGETSGAVADCLAHGVATVVTDIGPAHLLPDFVAKVPVDATPEMLARTVLGLLGDPADRAARALDGLAFVAEMGFERGARDLLAAVLPVPAWVTGPGPT